MFGWRTETDGTKAIAVRSYVPKSICLDTTQTPSPRTALSSGSTYYPVSSGSRQYYTKSCTSQQQQDGLVSLYLKGKNGTVQILLSRLGKSTRNKQKPSSSNPIQLGYIKTVGTHFTRNGNRNSLNLWIRDISLSCLTQYWLCVQRPFTLC